MQNPWYLYVLLCMYIIVYIPGGFSGLAPGSVSPTPKQKQNYLLKLIMSLDRKKCYSLHLPSQFPVPHFITKYNKIFVNENIYF